jgi:hypothetical protein
MVNICRVFRGPRRRSRRPRLRQPPEHGPKVVAALTFCRAVSTCRPAVAAAETRANLFYASNTLALKGPTEAPSYYLPPTQRPWVVGTPWLEQRARLLSCCCEEAEWFPSGRSMIVCNARLGRIVRPLSAPHRSFRLSLSAWRAGFPGARVGLVWGRRDRRSKAVSPSRR